MTNSDFPTSLDIMTTLVDEMDRPSAAWFNRLFHGLYKAEATLGTNPSDPNRGSGTAWNSGNKYTDVKTLMSKLPTVEVGRFEIDGTTEAPLEIDFINASRFTTSANIFIFAYIENDAKKWTAHKYGNSVMSIRESGGDPIGFNFYRRKMDNSDFDRTEEWVWIALENTL